MTTSSREARLTATLALIEASGGKWSAGRLHCHRRAHGGPVQRGTARRDLAALHQRGHLHKRGPHDGRYYTPTIREDGRS
jgi:hypothetical protein